MPESTLEELRRIAEAATGGPWHWAGNTDTGEPYLATWISGAGRCQVLSIGYDERSTSSPEAARVRADMLDCGYAEDDVDEAVADWAFDRHDQPIREPRLEFMTDLMCVKARDLAIYEVAPKATSRQDPEVYRVDVSGIRHPDAEHIATFDPPTVLALLDRLEKAEQRIEQAFTVINRDVHALANLDPVELATILTAPAVEPTT